jgi:hypothetical protein
MVKTAMSPRNIVLTVEPEEKITKIACALAGTDYPWSYPFRIQFIKEEELNLCMHFDGFMIICDGQTELVKYDLDWLP